MISPSFVSHSICCVCALPETVKALGAVHVRVCFSGTFTHGLVGRSSQVTRRYNYLCSCWAQGAQDIAYKLLSRQDELATYRARLFLGSNGEYVVWLLLFLFAVIVVGGGVKVMQMRVLGISMLSFCVLCLMRCCLVIFQFGIAKRTANLPAVLQS